MFRKRFGRRDGKYYKNEGIRGVMNIFERIKGRNL